MVDEVSVPRFTETNEYPATIPMLQNGWPPTGGPVNVAGDQGLLNWPLQLLTNRTHNLDNRLNEMALKAGNLVTVGAGGDYPSINAALSDLSERRPAYAPGGFMTEIRLLSGFIMAEQVLVSGINLGWMTITGEDAEHFIDRSYLTQQFGLRYPAFGVLDGGFLPTINCLFTMMQNGDGTDRSGVMAGNSGGARVMTDAGVRNAGGNGADVYAAGTLDISNAIFTGAGEYGLNAGGGTRVSALRANLANAGVAGIRAQYGATIQASQVDCSGAGVNGIDCRDGANINADNAQCRLGASDSSADIQVLRGGIVNAASAIGGTNITPNTVAYNGIIFK